MKKLLIYPSNFNLCLIELQEEAALAIK
ncbi:unnamed protein product [Lactuca saligna]|uniref:Uncharacterized protein n=1 Tax=Lactuca saligna TaxID=75948 RepID=A0AA35YN13_LACSI|nr:unnamed protein product [Lactuca saligna]